MKPFYSRRQEAEGNTARLRQLSVGTDGGTGGLGVKAYWFCGKSLLVLRQKLIGFAAKAYWVCGKPILSITIKSWLIGMWRDLKESRSGALSLK